MNSSDAARQEHDTIRLLLPWYLNRTLDHEESARVKSHIAQCEECQSDKRLLHEALDAATESQFDLDSSDTRLRRVMQRIDTYEQQHSSASINRKTWLQKLSQLVQGSGGWQRPVGFAFTVLVAVMAFQTLMPQNNSLYEVRSSVPESTGELALRVQLSQPLTESEVRTLLGNTKLDYSWHLSSDTELLIELPADMSASDVFAIISKLRSQPGVIAVETSLDREP